MKINKDPGLLTGAGLIIAIISGIMLPQASFVKFAIPWLLGLMLFFSFLTTDLSFKGFLQLRLILFPVIVWIILPPIVFFVTKNFEISLRTGLFIVSIAPPALGAPVIVSIIGGDKKSILSHTVLFNLLSPFAYAILFSVWFSSLSGVHIPVIKIFFKVATIIFLPFVISLIIRKIPKFKDRLSSISSFLSPLLLILVVFSACASASYKIREIPFISILKTGILVFIICIVLYFTGFITAKRLKTRLSFAIGMGQKNTSLAVWISMLSSGPLASVPAIIYIICHHTITALIILLQNKEN